MIWTQSAKILTLTAKIFKTVSFYILSAENPTQFKLLDVRAYKELSATERCTCVIAVRSYKAIIDDVPEHRILMFLL